MPRPIEVALAVEFALVLLACIPWFAAFLPLFGSHPIQLLLLIGAAVLWMKITHLFS